MAPGKSAEIRVGIVTLAAIIIAVVGIMLGRGVSISVTKSIVTIRLPHSGGLESGSPVVVNGVKRGSILNIRNANGAVIATAEVNNINDLTDSANAVVSILEITGGKKIEIYPGNGTKPLAVRDTIPGSVQPDIGNLVAVLGDVSGDAVSLVRNLDTVTMALSELLRDGSVIQNIRTAASDGAFVMADLRAIVGQNRAAVTETILHLNSLTKMLQKTVKDNEPHVGDIVNKLRTVLLRADSLLLSAEGTMRDADTLVVAANNLFTALKNNGSVLNKLLYDANMGKKLDTTLMELDRFIIHARRKGVNVNVGIGHR